MADLGKDLKKWLDTILEDNPDAVIGIDDGGLTLVVEGSEDKYGTEAYYELGGMPLDEEDPMGGYKKYNVIVTRDVTESTIATVMARNENEAEEKAYELAGKFGEGLRGWELDEGNLHEVYITGVDEIEDE